MLKLFRPTIVLPAALILLTTKAAFCQLPSHKKSLVIDLSSRSPGCYIQITEGANEDDEDMTISDLCRKMSQENSVNSSGNYNDIKKQAAAKKQVCESQGYNESNCPPLFRDFIDVAPSNSP